jgi:hypothetical protein
MPLGGTVAAEPQTDARGERHIWLDPHVVAKPNTCARPARVLAT